MKPRVTPRWPRFGSNVPLSSPDRARRRWLSPPEQGRSPRWPSVTRDNRRPKRDSDRASYRRA